MRIHAIRILVRLYRHKMFNFYVTNILVAIGHKTNLLGYKSIFERLEIRFFCLFRIPNTNTDTGKPN